MKNLTSKFSLFVSLFFLTALSPLLLKSSDANAIEVCNGGGYCATLIDSATCNAAKSTGTVATPAGGTGTTCKWSDVSNDNSFTRTLCNALNIITGTGGKAFAAFAIISLGIGFFTGKVSWGLMVGVTAGIAAMFGAPTIVAAIGGGGAINCKESAGSV